MTAYSFQCPACGAPLIPKGSASMVTCPHCFTSVVVPEELRQASSVAPWSTLVFENFLSNENNWLVGSRISEYFSPINQTIEDGRYRWDAVVIRDSSMSQAWLSGYPVSNFHLSIHSKHIRGGKTGSACGVVFRLKDNINGYWFRITDSQFFALSVQKTGQWSDIVSWTRTDAIKPNGVNQVEIIAQNTHFILLINGQVVSEVENDQFSDGLVGLAIEAYSDGEKTTFDFLDVTLRAP